MADYEWDPNAKRYRGPDGRFITQSTIKAIRNRLVDREEDRVRALADQAVTGKIGVDAFVRDMRAIVKQAYLMEYMLGRGGRHAMTPSDRGRVGAELKKQYQYLNRFADAINDRSVSRAQAQTRAAQYLHATRGAWDRGHAASWGVRLPAYPGDGGTSCMVNCRCSWDIHQVGKGKKREVRAYWRTNSQGPCDDCTDRARRYKPYRLPRPE